MPHFGEPRPFPIHYNRFVYEVSGRYYQRDGDTGIITAPYATVLAAVQAAIDAITEGVIFVKDLAEPAGVTYTDGVQVIYSYDGIEYTRTLLPLSSLTFQLNVSMQAIKYIRGDPTDPTEAAIAVFASEFVGQAALTKNFVAGFFGAKLISAEGIWAINAMVNLAAGSTGTAVAIEIDVDNNQALNRGVGLLITGIGTENPSYAIEITRADASTWGTTIIIRNKYRTRGIAVLNPDGLAGIGILNTAGQKGIELRTGTAGNRGVIKIYDVTATAYKYAYIDAGAWVIAAAEPT